MGYINNAEFVGGYEDAHRQRNYEKNAYRAWGANPQVIDVLFKNDAFTKLNRRRLFKALDTIPDKPFAVRLLHAIADSPDRSHIQSHLALYNYIATHSMRGDIVAYINAAPRPLIASKNGTVILPIYSDYLAPSSQLTAALQSLKAQGRQSELHVLGHASPEAMQMVRQHSVRVIELPMRGIWTNPS